MIADRRINLYSRSTSTESAEGSGVRNGADQAQPSALGADAGWAVHGMVLDVLFFSFCSRSASGGPDLKSPPSGIWTKQQWILPPALVKWFSVPSSFTGTKSKEERKKEEEVSKLRNGNRAAGCLLRQYGRRCLQSSPLIDRSPSCPAWWTPSSPSWTTYEGGKYFSLRVLTVCRRCWEEHRPCLSLSWDMKTDNLQPNNSLLPALNQAAV